MKLEPGLYRDGWGAVYLISAMHSPRCLTHEGTFLVVPTITNQDFIDYFTENEDEILFPLVDGDPVDFDAEG